MLDVLNRSGNSAVLPGAASPALRGAPPPHAVRVQNQLLRRAEAAAEDHQDVGAALPVVDRRTDRLRLEPTPICPVLLSSCPPVAVVLARRRMAGERVETCDQLEFDVVEVADAMGWQLRVVKRGLRQLQWSTGKGVCVCSLRECQLKVSAKSQQNKGSARNMKSFTKTNVTQHSKMYWLDF